MQIKYLLPRHGKVWGIDEEEYNKEVYNREKRLRLYSRLRSEGCSEKTALVAVRFSRSSLYRWRSRYKQWGLAGLQALSKAPNKVRSREWSRALENNVLAIRRQNVMYGKYKIHAILQRDHKLTTSVSTVGRILSDLIRREKIKPASHYYTYKPVRKRVFNKHSQRIKKGMRASNPGDLIQIDHMTVRLCANSVVKHFQAIDPTTKIVVTQAYSRATSRVGAQFLAYIRDKMPFPIKSIQVDGGSEFMGEFEEACRALDIPLYVLPPRSPEQNGVVERANSASKYEFYATYDGLLNLVAVRSKLRRFMHKFNHFRPHQALRYLTPMKYFQTIGGQESHML